MVYKIVQIILKVYLPVFFKKLEVRGLDNVPKDKPVLFAANHQNAFLDGMLVALHLKRPVYFLTRSDVFKGKWVLKFFNAFNLVPIFRKDDGHKDIQKKNRETFSYCIQEMEKGKPILIFPEGYSEPVHHLFRLKKGVARLALEAESKHNFNFRLHVVPVAVNYENHFLAGKKAYVEFLKPIIVSSYKNVYIENKSKANSLLLSRIDEILKESVVSIDGDYVKFKRRYWRGIIRHSRNDKEMMAALRSIPKDESAFSLKNYNWKREKYRYKREKPFGIKIFIFLVCLPGFLIYLPTIVLTKLLLWKIKDEGFYLSTICVGWLVFGLIQTIISFIVLWGELDTLLFFSAMFLYIWFGFISLRHFNKIP